MWKRRACRKALTNDSPGLSVTSQSQPKPGALITAISASFFGFTNDRHPQQILVEDVLRWRDELRSRRQKNATLARKLADVRSFIEYLRAAAWVTLNPASTKLLSPPLVSGDGAGRALNSKEVVHLLAGPDRLKPEGARDYALLP